MRHHGRILSFLGWLLIGSAALSAEPWTLERALGQALAHNPDARLARNRIAAAQAGLEQANAAFWPRVQLQSSYTRTDNPMMVFGSILNQRAYPSAGLNFNDVPDADDLNARGMVTMPLYAGGRNKASKEAAKANTEAAKQDDQAVRNALSFEVARSFHTVLKTREFVRASEAAVNSFQTNVAIANKRLEGGTLLKTDVLDLEVHLAQAHEDLVRARNANALALRTFATYWVLRRAILKSLTALQAQLPLIQVISQDVPSWPLPDTVSVPRRNRHAAPRQVTCRASAPSAASTTIMV